VMAQNPAGYGAKRDRAAKGIGRRLPGVL